MKAFNSRYAMNPQDFLGLGANPPVAKAGPIKAEDLSSAKRRLRDPGVRRSAERRLGFMGTMPGRTSTSLGRAGIVTHLPHSLNPDLINHYKVDLAGREYARRANAGELDSGAPTETGKRLYGVYHNGEQWVNDPFRATLAETRRLSDLGGIRVRLKGSVGRRGYTLQDLLSKPHVKVNGRLLGQAHDIETDPATGRITRTPVTGRNGEPIVHDWLSKASAVYAIQQMQTQHEIATKGVLSKLHAYTTRALAHGIPGRKGQWAGLRDGQKPGFIHTDLGHHLFNIQQEVTDVIPTSGRDTDRDRETLANVDQADYRFCPGCHACRLNEGETMGRQIFDVSQHVQAAHGGPEQDADVQDIYNMHFGTPTYRDKDGNEVVNTSAIHPHAHLLDNVPSRSIGRHVKDFLDNWKRPAIVAGSETDLDELRAANPSLARYYEQ